MTTRPAYTVFAPRTSHHGGLLLGTALIVTLGLLVRPPAATPVFVELWQQRAARQLDDLLATPGALHALPSGTLYLQMPGMRDPWGVPYQIRSIDRATGRICVLSLGPDRCEGTPDDIRREVDLRR